MIILDGTKSLTLDLLVAITTNPVEWSASFIETTSNCCSDCNTKKDNEGTNNGVAQSELISAPTTNTNTSIYSKQVEYIGVYNSDTASCTVIIKLGGQVLFRTILPTGYTLVYNKESGWQVYNTYGGTIGPVPISVSATYYARMADDNSGLVDGYLNQNGSSLLMNITKTIVSTNGTNKTSTFDFNSGRLAMTYTDGSNSSFLRLFAGNFILNGGLGANVTGNASGDLINTSSTFVKNNAPYTILGDSSAQTGVLKFANATDNFLQGFRGVAGGAADSIYTMPTDFPATSKILQSDASGVLTWITNAGGIIPTSYTVGDILYANTTTTLAKLSAGAAGTFLMYNGIGAAPIVSTLILPNSLTTNRILFGSATNTVGSNANFVWDVANSRFGVGTSAPSQTFQVTSSGFGSLLSGSNAGTSLTNVCALELSNTNATTNNYAGISFADTQNGSGSALMGVQFTDRTNHYGDYVFGTRGADGFLERWRSHLYTWSNTGSAGTAYIHLRAGTATASTGPFKFTNSGAVLLTTPESGVMETDADGLLYSTETSLQRKALTGCLYTQTTSVTVANTVTETSLLTSTTSLKTNFFKVGKNIHFRVSGIHSATANPTIRIRVKLGSTTILDTTAVSSGNSTNAFFEAYGDITCRTTGATGTVIGQGFYLEMGGGVSENPFPMTNTTTTTIDTTAAQTFDITAEWGTASASNAITCTNGFIEVLK